ncbi:hypothetical protein FTV88_1978 [Heliorestis convoluta]|uniref:Uncharacterized protein n=2 Tax=Heliorestis convoluta TaxID=356322 RepID=A0A5Q2N3A4_9FIRM|nr:hypothetical protein FTV88_1978 [Heliorestis convoluta]
MKAKEAAQLFQMMAQLLQHFGEKPALEVLEELIRLQKKQTTSPSLLHHEQEQGAFQGEKASDAPNSHHKDQSTLKKEVISQPSVDIADPWIEKLFTMTRKELEEILGKEKGVKTKKELQELGKKFGLSLSSGARKDVMIYDIIKYLERIRFTHHP